MSLLLIGIIVSNNSFTMEEENSNIIINNEKINDKENKINNTIEQQFKKWSYDKLKEWLFNTDNSQNDKLAEYRNYISELLNDHTSVMKSMTGFVSYNVMKKLKQYSGIGTTYNFTEIKKFFETESNKQIIDNILIDNIKEYIMPKFQEWSYQILVDLLLNGPEKKQEIITANVDDIKTNMFNLLYNPDKVSREQFCNIYKQYISDYLNGITNLKDNLMLQISKVKQQFFYNNNYKDEINKILSQNIEKFLDNYIVEDETYTKILEYCAGKKIQLSDTIKTKMSTQFEELSLNKLKACVLDQLYYNNDKKTSMHLNIQISKYILSPEDYTKVSDSLINAYEKYLSSYADGNFSSVPHGILMNTSNKIEEQNNIKAVFNNVNPKEIKKILRRNIFSLKSNSEIVNYIKNK